MNLISDLAGLVAQQISLSSLTLVSSLTYYMWFVGIVATVTFQYRRYIASKLRHAVKAEPAEKPKLLFPLIAEHTCIEKLSSNGSPCNENGPQPCSTGLTTRLLPFKNDKGEIDWVFSDDLAPGNDLDAFKVSPINRFVKNDVEPTSHLASNNATTVSSEIGLSPVTSASSNNDSLLGKKLRDLSVLQIHTPSSSSSEDHKDDDDENGDQNYQCPHCSSNFKMRGYLTRHLKKHLTQKAYKCPFHDNVQYKPDAEGSFKCHPTGGFSRRDTYKTHLKSRHFTYPRGTSTKDRTQTSGTCGMCGEWFQNAEIWTEIHIEGAECKFLPAGFKGKSRIKNRLKKQMARMMKEQKQQGHKTSPHYSSLKSEYQSPAFATPVSTVTPLFNSSANDLSDSPTQSVSSVGPSTVASTSAPYLATPQLLDLLQAAKHISRPHTAANMEQMASMDPLTRDPAFDSNLEDYDDEYCLDTEQMSYPMPLHNATMMHPDPYSNVGFPTQMSHIMSQYSH
ncbi:hypothetical protein PUMCH_004062 [Australozyma saopauloensis]|uniref:C2H2-type domain-containing protein n=1 Tax=Australozyma saopauloensis TaxID=291208 RepID=A0AAX4HDK3_9ASCO|nr:hypothetical protein PUMCH_004062 [[Candida] saopauloensis]